MIRREALAAALFAVCIGWAVAVAAAADEVPPLGRATTTCITRTQVVEGATNEWCATTLKSERDGLLAEGLVDAEPLLVVTADGRVERGRSTATLTGQGRSVVDDGAATCIGEYNSNAVSTSQVIAERCTDGRTGVAKRTWVFANQGEGTVRMSDGATARFAFGCSTGIGAIETCPVVHAAPAVMTVRPLPPAAARAQDSSDDPLHMIQRRLMPLLIADRPRVAQVRVTYAAGVVTLSGVVPDSRTRDDVDAMAVGVPGVRTVVDDIIVGN